MEFKGTKGKWVLRTFDGGQMSVRNEEDTRKICVSRVNNYEESKHNLLIMSKAPEMLEMLKYIVNEVENGQILDGEDLFDIKQLIKQATEL